MEAMSQYMKGVSLLEPSALVVILILVVNLGLTLVHTLQELKGCLWRYFGAIAGVRIPDVVGFSFFFFGLTIALWTMGFAGITGYVPVFGRISEALGIGALGVLIGSRFSDRLYSHVRLDHQGYRPNPGLKSTPYYFAEAVIMMVLFSSGLVNHYIAASVGFVIGWLIFYSVLPLIRLLRMIPRLRRMCRKPGEIMPSWSRD